MFFSTDDRVLVVAAHPDDEVLGCGGTILKAVKNGAKVAVMFLGEGISARFPIGEYGSEEFNQETKKRFSSAINALRILGVTDYWFAERLCCQFDSEIMLTIVKEIEQRIKKFQPTTILTHDRSEVNIDHRVTYDAVEAACRPTMPNPPKQIFSFEIICSGSWTFESSFKPNVFVDVSDVWEKKMKAWHCYEGERRPFPFPRSDEGIQALAAYRGLSAGLQKAEGFKLLRKIM